MDNITYTRSVHIRVKIVEGKTLMISIGFNYNIHADVWNNVRLIITNNRVL